MELLFHKYFLMTQYQVFFSLVCFYKFQYLMDDMDYFLLNGSGEISQDLLKI
jgi:hypothetical protein